MSRKACDVSTEAVGAPLERLDDDRNRLIGAVDKRIDMDKGIVHTPA